MIPSEIHHANTSNEVSNNMLHWEIGKPLPINALNYFEVTKILKSRTNFEKTGTVSYRITGITKVLTKIHFSKSSYFTGT